jgi:hypothetical protein
MTDFKKNTPVPQCVQIDVMPSFYCNVCKSKYPCSTQNFGIKCEFELKFEIDTYGKIIE